MADDPSMTIDRRTIEANLRDPSPDDQSPGGGKGGEPPPLNYRDFAWLAETLDGRRDEYVKIILVKENGTLKLVVRNHDYMLESGETLVLDGIRTDNSVRGRPEVTVTVGIGERPTVCRTDDGLLCDAVFCSESAIEKFVFPYYHSQRLLTDAEWVRLTAEVMNPSTMAIGHAHPSRSMAFHRESRFYALTDRGGMGIIPDLHWKRLI
jgi:hypothetical protein